MNYKAGDQLSDLEAMRLAIAEARKGVGSVAPNPPVGCVILSRDRRLVAVGYHKKCGGPHAEVEALSQVADPALLKGAHVFVTLEPCAHFGKTPPCAEALAQLPLARVIYGLEDPNPLVAGQGAKRVQAAGIITEVWRGQDLPELEELIEVFRCNIEKKRAFVAVKAAVTLDGCVAESSGKSQWITGPESRKFVHQLRANFDAVLVGRNTVESDNPRLNIRGSDGEERSNRVVLLDPNNRLSPGLKQLALWQCRDSASIFQAVRAKLGDEVGGGVEWRRLLVKGREAGGMDLADLTSQLFSEGICSVLVEGGAFTHSSFFQSALVDRLYLFISPKALGGKAGLNWLQHFESRGLDYAPKLKSRCVMTFGEDILISGRLSFPPT